MVGRVARCSLRRLPQLQLDEMTWITPGPEHISSRIIFAIAHAPRVCIKVSLMTIPTVPLLATSAWDVPVCTTTPAVASYESALLRYIPITSGRFMCLANISVRSELIAHATSIPRFRSSSTRVHVPCTATPRYLTLFAEPEIGLKQASEALFLVLGGSYSVRRKVDTTIQAGEFS